MAEPNSSLVFEDILTEMAELVGIADYDSSTGISIHPNDKGDINRLKRIANNGIRGFIASAPPLGWNWMKRIMSVALKISTSGTADGNLAATSFSDSTLVDTYATDYYVGLILEVTGGVGIGETALVTDYDGDYGLFTFSGGLSGGSTPTATTTYTIGHRYALDQTFGGQVTGGITYLRGSGVGPIEWINELPLRQRRQSGSAGGNPRQAAVRPYGIRRYELVVYPDPGAAEVIQFPYTYYFNKLDILTGVATAAGALTTLTDTGRTEPNDYFNTDWIVEVVSGTGKGSYGVVTDFVKATGVITVAAWLDIDGTSTGTTPASGDEYRLLPVSNLQPAGFAFDNVIRLACMAAAEVEMDDVQTIWEQKYTRALGNAHKIDARLAPRTVGNFGGKRGGYSAALARRRYYSYGGSDSGSLMDTN